MQGSFVSTRGGRVILYVAETLRRLPKTSGPLRRKAEKREEETEEKRRTERVRRDD
jgi:hypothetical protein